MTEARPLRTLILRYIRGDPNKDTAEFHGRRWTTGEMAAHVDSLDAILQSCGVPTTASVGLIARNRIGNAIAASGLFANGRSVSMVYSQQAASKLVAEVARLNLAVVIAHGEDWTDELEAHCAGRVQIAVSDDPDELPRLRSAPDHLLAMPRSFDEQTVEILTSGTTGPPKLIPFRLESLMRFVDSATLGGTVKPPPSTLVYFPLGGLGGLMHLILSLATGAFFELQERFDVDAWAAAVRRHGIESLAVSPAMVRMILERNVPREALASLKAVYGGSGELEDDVLRRFEEVYGVPLYWGYGATEFGGSLVSWTESLRQEFGHRKTGSAGRVLPGLKARITDPETGRVLGVSEKGRLKAHVPLMSADWIGTNDLASIDEDGFVYIHGRMDGAINRGGFKIHPETIVAALRAHPAVRDAAAFGVKDIRLGQVPLAAIELADGVDAPTADALMSFLREMLPPQSLPVRIEVLPALPRTQSLKVDLSRLHDLYPGSTTHA